MCTCDTARRIGPDLHSSCDCPDRCGQQHVATACQESYKERGPHANVLRLGLLLCLQSSHSHLPESGVQVEVHALTDCCAKQSRLQTPVEPCPAMFTDDLDKAARCCVTFHSYELIFANYNGLARTPQQCQQTDQYVSLLPQSGSAAQCLVIHGQSCHV